MKRKQKKYPSFLWRLSSNKYYKEILRLFTNRKTEMIYFSRKTQNYELLSLWTSTSQQTLLNLIIHAKLYYR